MPGRKRSAIPLVLAAAVLAAACTRPDPVAPEGAGPGDPGYRSVVARRDLAGNPVGHDGAARATVVIVFASWCYPCRKELAILRELAAEHPTVRVIGVNAFEDFDDLSDDDQLAAFIGTNHPWLTVVRGDAALLRSLGGVSQIPTVFVFDGRGTTVEVFRRSERAPPSKKELDRLLSRLHG